MHNKKDEKNFSSIKKNLTNLKNMQVQAEQDMKEKAFTVKDVQEELRKIREEQS